MIRIREILAKDVRYRNYRSRIRVREYFAKDVTTVAESGSLVGTEYTTMPGECRGRGGLGCWSRPPGWSSC